MADGLFAILAALQRRRHLEAPRWAYLSMGLVDIGAGLVALFWPRVTLLVLLYLVAAKALIDGILQIMAAIRLREQLRNEWLVALSGVASLAFAALLIMFPAASIVGLVLWIGVYALVYGATLLVLAMRLHAWERRHSNEGEVPLSRPAPSSSGGH